MLYNVKLEEEELFMVEKTFYMAYKLDKILKWAIPEKIQKGGRGLRRWNIQGSIKKEKEFPGVIKKNSCGISMGFVFGLGNSNGCSTILWNFHG